MGIKRCKIRHCFIYSVYVNKYTIDDKEWKNIITFFFNNLMSLTTSARQLTSSCGRCAELVYWCAINVAKCVLKFTHPECPQRPSTESRNSKLTEASPHLDLDVSHWVWLGEFQEYSQHMCNTICLIWLFPMMVNLATMNNLISMKSLDFGDTRATPLMNKQR